MPSSPLFYQVFAQKTNLSTLVRLDNTMAVKDHDDASGKPSRVRLDDVDRVCVPARHAPLNSSIGAMNERTSGVVINSRDPAATVGDDAPMIIARAEAR